MAKLSVGVLEACTRPGQAWVLRMAGCGQRHVLVAYMAIGAASQPNHRYPHTHLFRKALPAGAVDEGAPPCIERQHVYLLLATTKGLGVAGMRQKQMGSCMNLALACSKGRGRGVVWTTPYGAGSCGVGELTAQHAWPLGVWWGGIFPTASYRPCGIQDRHAPHSPAPPSCLLPSRAAATCCWARRYLKLRRRPPVWVKAPATPFSSQPHAPHRPKDEGVCQHLGRYKAGAAGPQQPATHLVQPGVPHVADRPKEAAAECGSNCYPPVVEVRPPLAHALRKHVAQPPEHDRLRTLHEHRPPL